MPGWDFIEGTENGTDDIWWILEGQDYPQLWWESADAEFLVWSAESGGVGFGLRPVRMVGRCEGPARAAGGRLPISARDTQKKMLASGSMRAYTTGLPMGSENDLVKETVR